MLVILDRNMDLCTPLHHTWTYQALVHDVLVSQVNIQLSVLGAISAVVNNKYVLRSSRLSCTYLIVQLLQPGPLNVFLPNHNAASEEEDKDEINVTQ